MVEHEDALAVASQKHSVYSPPVGKVIGAKRNKFA
jgi:hypothetical protein